MSRQFFLPRHKTVFLLLAIMGAVVGLWGGFLIREGITLRTWPVVTGVVLKSEIAGERAVHPNIVYSYVQEGTRYEDSSSLDPSSFGGRSARRQTATIIAGGFKPGDSLSVSVDPRNPHRSTLRPYVHWSAYGILGFGLTLLTVSLVLVLTPRKSAVTPNSMDSTLS